MSDRDPDKSQMPAWLVGLIIAAALFVVGLWVFTILGFGDDPVIGQVLIPGLLGWRGRPKMPIRLFD